MEESWVQTTKNSQTSIRAFNSTEARWLKQNDTSIWVQIAISVWKCKKTYSCIPHGSWICEKKQLHTSYKTWKRKITQKEESFSSSSSSSEVIVLRGIFWSTWKSLPISSQGVPTIFCHSVCTWGLPWRALLWAFGWHVSSSYSDYWFHIEFM